jgi:hypothetical protein
MGRRRSVTWGWRGRRFQEVEEIKEVKERKSVKKIEAEKVSLPQR